MSIILGENKLSNIIKTDAGTGGTTNYVDLDNKPSINGVELVGDKNSSDLGLNSSYTAGTNIEITEDNVINNMIPYEENVEDNVINIGQITRSNNNNNVNIGLDVENYSNNSVLVGNHTYSAGENTLVIGNNARAQNQGSIALGHNATTSMQNQFTLGSTTFPINEMKVVTSDGAKYIATTDQLTADTTPKVYSITPENNSEENPFVFSENPTGLYLISTPTIYYKDFPENTVVSKEINYPGVLFYHTKLTSDIEIEDNFVTIAIYYTFNMTDRVQEYIETDIRFYETTRRLDWGATNNIMSITPLNYTNKVKLPAGGTAGQILMKNSDTDYDCSWTSLDSYDEVMF